MALFRRYVVEHLDPEKVPDWVFVTNVIQYTQVATVTILVYDIRKCIYLYLCELILYQAK